MAEASFDTIRRMIDELKVFAQVNGYNTPEDLIVRWFDQQTVFNLNFRYMKDEYQRPWIMIAEAAIKELKTGSETPLY